MDATESIVGIGSNLGSREAFARMAARVLEAHPRIELVALSSRYLTPPVGPPQPAFVNAAVRLRTTLSPAALLAELLRVEASLGRVRRERWGPRTLDLDLLWWSGGIVEEPNLRVPHPRLRERGFALGPLLEVAPELGAIYGDDLARAGAPEPEPWARAARIDGGVEVVALDDADALALALTETLGAGVSQEVGAITAPDLDRLLDALPVGASIALESLGPGAVVARVARAPEGGAHPSLRIAGLAGGRCRIILDPGSTRRNKLL